MPPENRSSNTESKIQPLAQHPEGRRERFLKWVLATKHPVLGYLDGTWLARGDDREGYADKYVQGLWVAYKEFGQPAPQPHPDPIAWMVGTAIWWTKEEAERDAADTGLPIVGLGPMAGHGEVERCEARLHEVASLCASVEQERDALRAQVAECEAMAAMIAEREWAEHAGTGPVSSKVEAAFTQLHNDLHEAGEKITERDALLDRVVGHANFWHDHPYAEVVEAIAKDYRALSASADPQVKS